jgi:FtsZ-binding cell division protein ZapB
LLGEVQYRQRLEDIRILKLEIKKLRREKAMLSRTVANSDELKYDEQILNVEIHSVYIK